MIEEEKAFREALVSCVDKGMFFARSLTRGTADAEDLVQDALIKAMRNWGAFEAGTNMQAWLNRIIKNTFLDKMKRHEETKTETVGEDTFRLEQEVKPAAEGVIRAEEVHDFMYSQMPDGERSVVLLWAEGYSYEEIAQDLGISRSNAGVILCRARKRLFERFGSAVGVLA